MFLKPRLNFKKLTQLCCNNIDNQNRNFGTLRRNLILKRTPSQNSFLRNYSIEATPHSTAILRGKAASMLQESFIHELTSNDAKPTSEDWSKLMESVPKIEFGMINSSNIHGKVITFCHDHNNLNAAKSYLKYMRENGMKYNSAVVTGFIKLCYLNRSSLKEEDLALIDRFTKFLIAKYVVLDSIIGEALMKGLCLKNNIEKCASVLEQIKKCVKPNSSTISAYIVCLLENNEFEKAWKIMEEYANVKNFLSNEIFVTYIDKKKAELKEIQRLLRLFQFYDIIPNKVVCDRLIEAFSQFPSDKRLTATYTSVKNNGKCNNCNQKLNRVDISDEEFDVLREAFLNRVLKKDDIFKNTSPEELEKFKECVEQNAPFDIVIDGLNVAYMAGTLKSNYVYAKLLTDTVRHFVERGQKVLVIGRKHMYNYSKESLAYVRKNSTLFFIDDNSEDDPYMIYSTLKSGPDACFVTRDLMRSEKYKLSDEKLEYLFKKWQQSHQIFINFISPGTGKLYLKSPITFEMSAQRSECGWHIPYHLETHSSADEYGVHQYWLCLK